MLPVPARARRTCWRANLASPHGAARAREAGARGAHARLRPRARSRWPGAASASASWRGRATTRPSCTAPRRAKRLLGPMAYLSAAVREPAAARAVAGSRMELDGAHGGERGAGHPARRTSRRSSSTSRSRTATSRATACSTWWCSRRKTAFERIPAVLAGLLDRGGEFPDRTGALEIHRARDGARGGRPAHGGAVRRRGHATSPRRSPRASCAAPPASS